METNQHLSVRKITDLRVKKYIYLIDDPIVTVEHIIYKLIK